MQSTALSEKVASALADVVERLRERYQPRCIILFGSHVWGEPHAESDFDLLVVREGSDERGREWFMESLDPVLPAAVRPEVHVITAQKLRERVERGDPFLRKIVTDGIVLYGEKEDYDMSKPTDHLMAAKEWIGGGDEDLQTAMTILAQGSPLRQACFHAEQAAQKFLKAFLQGKGVVPPKTHDLEKLLEECEKLEPSFQKFSDAAKELKELYISTRYPPLMPVPTPQQAQGYLAKAHQIREEVVQALGLQPSSHD